MISPNSPDENEEEVKSSSGPDHLSISQENMDWWSDISDLERLNVLNSPLEDRARILASKTSTPIEQTMLEIGRKTNLTFLNRFELSENPTKLIPLRLIHSFNCLPIEANKDAAKLPKILCVDDEVPILKGFELHLQKEFEVHTALSGEEGLKKFRSEGDFVMVLSDMQMPGMNGASMLSEINKIDPTIISILLTGHSDINTAKEAIDSGKVNRILTKPYPTSDLIVVLNQCLAEFEKNKSSKPLLDSNEGKINLLTVWPPTPRMSQWVYAVSGKKPIWFLGLPEKINHAITENFGIGADSLDDSDLEDNDEEDKQDDLEDQNAAIIRFVNEVILKAIVDRATDIHFEPHKETLQIRYRIDGQLVPVRVPDNLRSFQDAIISRIKIMSGINISEKRRPQGGRITFSHGQSDLDIRVSTLPTLYGESVSLRLLNEKSQPLSMPELGLSSTDEKNVVSVLEKPHGIVLVTGPTGSGKSTSLTAFIRKIHKPERRIMTVEDPVEYEVAGINQTQVNSDIGFNFASALREILRQDPDVIMVGEIRDKETASVALRASMTGHLVLSTLHTNTTIGAINRLKDLGIDTYLISSSLNCVIAQRLLRKYCINCKDNSIKSGSDYSENLVRLEGCSSCNNTGYQGRVAIFDYLKVDNTLKSRISNDEFISENSIMGKTILENEAQKLVNKNIVPKFEAKRMSLDIK